jgi:hypothetical protein
VIALSRHARSRARQRGIGGQTLADVASHADVEIPAGAGCIAINLSHRRLIELAQLGMPASRIERCRSVALVLGPDGTVITALHMAGGQGRRYRRRKAGGRPWVTHGRRS